MVVLRRNHHMVLVYMGTPGGSTLRSWRGLVRQRTRSSATVSTVLRVSNVVVACATCKKTADQEYPKGVVDLATDVFCVVRCGLMIIGWWNRRVVYIVPSSNLVAAWQTDRYGDPTTFPSDMDPILNILTKAVHTVV